MARRTLELGLEMSKARVGGCGISLVVIFTGERSFGFFGVDSYGHGNTVCT
jgi:hypothetical protein